MKCLEKRLYITEVEAIKAQHSIKKKRGINTRIYQCHICRGFHLTSKEFNP